MLLESLLGGVNVTGVVFPDGYTPLERQKAFSDIQITGIATDCSRVSVGDAFICIVGEHTDGHLYALDAVNRGASVIVAQRSLKLNVPVIIVENTRVAAAFMWNNRYLSPAKDMKVIAVTGTNGKTSVCFMIREILRTAGYNCGLIGTVKCMAGNDELYFGGGSEIAGKAASMTTPDPEFLYGILYEMRLRGVTHVIMEASSHALSQHKLDPLSIDTAVFTGLSPEHLDFHGTMENYLSAKSVLFRSAKRGIINWDDSYAEKLTELVACDYIKAGVKDGGRFPKGYHIWAENIRRHSGEVMYRLRAPGIRVPVKCSMPGVFGVYNSLLASAVSLELGVRPEIVAEALRRFDGVPGRMETVARLGELRVVRDYAHTPDALMRAAQITKEETGRGKLWLLFGCGGDRDRTKRPEMGRIATQIADYTVITSDNCRTEDRDSIIDDIVAGVDKTKQYTVIPDREEAIYYAVMKAGNRDTVLLCGKGHENYDITASGMRPFDEKTIARSAVKKRKRSYGR